jgi:hypothetical protein
MTLTIPCNTKIFRRHTVRVTWKLGAWVLSFCVLCKDSGAARDTVMMTVFWFRFVKRSYTLWIMIVNQ